MTKSNKILLGITGVALTALLLFFLLPRQYIVIEAEGFDSILLDATTFELHWVHSIEKEEWFEIYAVNDNGLLLETSHFKTFGAGVPSSNEGRTYFQDGFVVYEINHWYDAMYLNVSENVATTIVQSGEEYPLYEWFDSYVSVTINVKQIPYICAMRR